MSGDSGGGCVCAYPTQSLVGKKDADDKNEPELSSLCRTGESDALF